MSRRSQELTFQTRGSALAQGIAECDLINGTGVYMTWETHRVRDFKGFVGALEGLLPSTVKKDGLVNWFRGQSNDHWSLQPSLLRGLGKRLHATSAISSALL